MAEKFGIKYEDSKVKKQGGLDREILEWIQEKEGGIANEYLYFNECSISEKGIQVIVKDNKDTVIIFSLSLALEKCQKENEYDQIVLIAKQLQEMFPKICGVDKYQYDINGGDYTIDGRQKWRIAFVLKKESVEEKNIINYNFHRIEVSLDENNNVYSITIHNENLNNKIGDYPIITVEEAKNRLLEQRYWMSATYPPNQDNNSITLTDVKFGYHEKEILHGVNMKLEAGTVNAIVGPSGSGKSTIAKLIASLWDVNSGSIKIGGVNVRQMSLTDFNQKIAYVAQDNYLFNESVRENIRQGNPNATDEQIIEVTKKSGCYDFIMQLENGFDTIVGGAGGHLSGGERQRISIARAMLKDAPIVILDEATAYTDPENEAILQNSIARLVAGKTLIVIAHRLSTVKDSDQIFVVNDGNIAAHGIHNELLASCPLYKEMWNAHISSKDTVKEEN